MANPFDTERWEEVKSSNIEAIGVRGDWLIVRFKKNGLTYRYYGFADLFDELVSSKSVGKLFNQEVLSNTKGERLRQEEWPDEY
jgi:hypothetical protein